MSPKIKKISLACLFFLVFLLPKLSFANELSSPSGFSIEPAIQKISVMNNTQLKSGFSVVNTGKDNITFTVRVVDFVPANNYGGIKELEYNGDPDDQILASGWFSIPSEPMSLSAKQKISIPYSVTVPKDASPGGRSLSFIIESTSGNVHSRLNALCFLTVPGDATEKIEIVNFSFSPKIAGLTKGDIHLEIKNSGKAHVNPDGKLVVRNMFGVVRGSFPLDEDLSLGTIIPSAKKSIDYEWKASQGLFDFGIWNAKIEFNYGINGNHSISDRTFFMLLPYKTILYILIIVGGSIFFFIFSIKKLRSDISQISNAEAVDEKSISLKLLVIPFISGLLLLIVSAFSIYSIFEYRGEGGLKKVNIGAIK